MRKFQIILIGGLFTCLLFPNLLWSDDNRIITLQDGSTLKGKVLSANDNTYTIQTENLGTVQINGKDIVSIVSADTAQTTLPSSQNPGDIKTQVQQLQDTVLSDSEIVSDIKDITQDPEVMSIINDPELLKTILSYDAQKIQDNSKVQQLLGNEKMQKLMNKIQGKFIPPSQSQK